MVEKCFPNNGDNVEKSVLVTMQQELDSIRNTLHNIIYNMLTNLSTREPTMDYLRALLRSNEKRVRLHSDERSFSGDGLLLNLLYIFQRLSVRIKFDKIDFMYPFHPGTFLDITNDTRVYFTSSQALDWVDKLSKYLFSVEQ